MNRLGLGILAVLLVLALGLWGCGGSEPQPPPDEDVTVDEPADEAPPPPPEKPADEAPPPPPEEETAEPPASGTQALYAEAEALHRQANAAWKAYQADRTRENWEKAKEVVGKAQELCDRITTQDPEFEPVHELGMKCNSLRRMILDMEPTE